MISRFVIPASSKQFLHALLTTHCAIVPSYYSYTTIFLQFYCCKDVNDMEVEPCNSLWPQVTAVQIQRVIKQTNHLLPKVKWVKNSMWMKYFLHSVWYLWSFFSLFAWTSMVFVPEVVEQTWFMFPPFVGAGFQHQLVSRRFLIHAWFVGWTTNRSERGSRVNSSSACAVAWARPSTIRVAQWSVGDGSTLRNHFIWRFNLKL